MTDILNEAHGLIRGERARHYGPPHNNINFIADLWTTFLKPRLKDGESISGTDVCNLMILLKVAREGSGQAYHRDSTVDIAGYDAIKEILNEYTPEQFIAEMERVHGEDKSEPISKQQPGIKLQDDA